MKKLKISLFSIVFILSLISCRAQQKIAVIVDANTNRIVCNLSTIKQSWEERLVKQNTPASLVSFEIIKQQQEGTGLTYYMLLARNSDSTLKMAKQLIRVGNDLVFSKLNPLGDTVVCQGCSHGCSPGLGQDGNYYCTSCTEGSGCTKTVTVNTTVILNRP